jgi:hypothetical protein
MASEKSESAGIWLRPLSSLLGIAAVLVVAPSLVDSLLLEGRDADCSWIQNLPEVFAGVIGIAITVVAIIVELAANRYTSRITELFFKAHINSAVLGFFVVSCVQCIWVSFQTSDAIPWAPVIGSYVALGSVTISLVLLLPYFVFVFTFLNPRNVIRRIKQDTLATIGQVRAVAADDVDGLKARVIDGIEQMADIALNAIENKDKAISMDSVDALRELTIEYLSMKPDLPAPWFDVTAPIRGNSDFVSMTPDTQQDLMRRKLWLEMKVLRQYQMLYGEALNRTRDLNYLIAIDSRLLGERVLADGDLEAHGLVIKFFNTYLRQTINARDVRTAYNVLNQYRLLAESALAAGETEPVEKIAFYFKYYGQVAFGQGLPFVLETVAYDLCALNELAHDLDAPNKRAMLADFLDVDKESDVEHEHEASLRGVRKAQVKLATYYLVKGAPELAREVWKDMKDEVQERLVSIKQELVAIQAKEYWEVIDRGANFDYLEPRRREKLEEFFSWFGESLEVDPGRPSSIGAPTRSRTSA